MDIQLFQTFCLVAKLNNITQAAEQLNFTQPAVTAQIRMLEERYGITLFERIGKKLYITEAGRAMLSNAETLLLAYEELNDAMEQFSAFVPTIRIGVSTTAASYIISTALLEFQRTGLPGAVTVDVCPTLPDTIKGLLDNEFDLAILHDKITNRQIRQVDLSHEKLVWVVSRELFEKSKHNPDGNQYAFINYRPWCIYRMKFEETLQEKDIHPVIELSDSEAIKRAVLEGVGVSILPYVLVESLLAEGTLVELPASPRLTFSLSAAFHKDKIFTPSVQKLFDILTTLGNVRP